MLHVEKRTVRNVMAPTRGPRSRVGETEISEGCYDINTNLTIPNHIKYLHWKFELNLTGTAGLPATVIHFTQLMSHPQAVFTPKMFE